MIVRIVLVVAAFCATLVSLQPFSARAQSPADERVVHVVVVLAGHPLGADPNLRGRTTSGRYGLDAQSAVAKSYWRALSGFQRDQISFLRARHIDIQVQRRFEVLLNGLSATVPQSQVGRLRDEPNVRSVLPIRRYQPLLDRSIRLIHAPKAWASLGGSSEAGKGMAIANVDSGIDITHPCFRDAGYAPPPAGRRADTNANLALTNNKVIVARAFGQAGKQYSAADRSGANGGHGTFTAAIEACDFHTATPLGTAISGVAPAAYLMNDNIFPNGASLTSADDPVIPALEAAVLDGADVINLSFGDVIHRSTLLNPDVLAVESAIKNGIVVVAAAGNAGPTPQSMASPATAPDVIAVGSTSNSRMVTSTVDVASGGTVSARYQALQGTHPFTAPAGPAQLLPVGFGRKPGDDSAHPSANDFAGKDLRGKIALIERGAVPFSTKLTNAEKAGARGAIVFDNAGESHLQTMDARRATIPALFVSLATGSTLTKLTAEGSTSVTLNPTPTPLPETPNVLSDFSSRGVGSDYAIKPDLVAPGEDIYSAVETRFPGSGLYSPTGFSSASGTSFSAPHVSGVVALMRQHYPTWTPTVIRSILMNTAQETVRSALTGSALPSVMQMGSGLVDAAAALAATSYASPGSISFGSLNPSLRQVSRTAHVTLTNIRGGTYFSVAVHQLHSSPFVTFAVPARQVLAPGASAQLSVSVSVGPNAPTGNYDGFFEAQHGTESIHIAYFVHVARQPIRPGSILLVDNSASPFMTNVAMRPPHRDLSGWYRSALQHIGRAYTYWNESVLGSPTLDELQRASAVLYFTGPNLNGWVSQSSEESLLGPIAGTDLDLMQTYLREGGRLFVSGMGATLSDFDWSSVVLGAAPTSFSAYDSKRNDPQQHGGISPPRPSALVDNRSGPAFNRWLFAAMKPIDFSATGDGARDMASIASPPVRQVLGQALVGIPSLNPVRGNFGWQGKAFGQAVLRAAGTALIGSGRDVAVVSSDEPTLSHRPTFAGRSVLFSFGFESINNNTGYATREQVLRRVLSWLFDRPRISVPGRAYRLGQNTLSARVSGGTHIVQYLWQIGNRTVGSLDRPTTFTFTGRGRYRVRVQVFDSLGHSAVTSWFFITVK